MKYLNIGPIILNMAFLDPSMLLTKWKDWFLGPLRHISSKDYLKSITKSSRIRIEPPVDELWSRIE